jgi:cellulose synthase/poly-beta-1,6-N-acetylglucosamine synthase-like glycosyltransferase
MDQEVRAASVVDGQLAAFVVPFYGDQEFSVRYLMEAIEGFDNQTDPNWRAIIVDDATPPGDATAYLAKVEEERKEHIHVIRLPRNMGHGYARNVAVEYAAANGYPFIMYNDADDISHPDRVRVVRAAFAANPLVDLVYSTFEAIDEDRRVIPEDKMSTPLLALLNFQRSRPIVGQDAWIRMGLESVASLPSSTALRTSAALACPSPLETPAEDYYQALHVSAAGGSFLFTPDAPSQYRVTSSVTGSSHHRKRIGVEQFNRNLAKVRTAGFKNALRVAANRGHWCSNQAHIMMTMFYLRLADNLLKVDQSAIVEDIVQEHLAASHPAISAHLTAALEKS